MSSRARPSLLLCGEKLPAKRVATLLRKFGFGDIKTSTHQLADVLAVAGRREVFLNLADRFLELAETSADPDRALLNLTRFLSACTPATQARLWQPAALELLVKIFGSSQALSDTLIRTPHLLDWLLGESGGAPKTKADLRRELDAELDDRRGTAMAEKLTVIRLFRRRQTLRIGARDLLGRASLEETTLELSNLADVCLETVYHLALDELMRKHGIPVFQDADGKIRPATFCVIGLGKLGGQELNYSSDVDVIFVYSRDGHVHGHDGTQTALTNEEFFTKLAETIIAAVGTLTPEGSLYRIDLRLRPEGPTGPLVRSCESCEYYYSALGETWERLALVKARPVAGDENLGREFLRMVEPFVYRRYGGEAVVRDMAAIKTRIEREAVKAGQLTRHVKLGIGGIREIEFVLQSLQALHGGRHLEMRCANTLRGLESLKHSDLMPSGDVDKLVAAYRFLRVVEHRLQMEADLQTHTVPEELAALKRLARSMGYRTVSAFHRARQAHTRHVRRIYRNLLLRASESARAKRGTLGASTLLAGLSPDDAQSPAQDEAFLKALSHAGFAEPAIAAKTFGALAYGPGFTHVSSQTSERFVKLVPKILSLAHRLADPDSALQQFERFVERYGSRAALYDAFNANSRLVELLLRLFDNSRFLGETFLRWPELFDEVVRGGALAQSKDAHTMLEELQNGARDGSWETAAAWARSYKRVELARITLADILGLADLAWTHAELTFLAEAALRFALAVCQKEQRLDTCPLAIVGLGKFGGQELGYGADLDVIFVASDDTDVQTPAARLAERLTEFMARQTSEGVLYKLDARLRPDGETGPLAPSLEACRRYYQKRAWTWEKLALTKARFVAGNAETGQSFMRLAHGTIYARALTPAELSEIRAMRQRIERERGMRGRRELSFKTAPGGLMDVEFIVQTLQLRHGFRLEPLRCTPTLAALGRLTANGLVEETDSYALRRDYLFLRRIESVLRRYDNAPVSSLPESEIEQQQLAKRLGFSTRDEFWKTYRTVQRRIREVYNRLTR